MHSPKFYFSLLGGEKNVLNSACLNNAKALGAYLTCSVTCNQNTFLYRGWEVGRLELVLEHETLWRRMKLGRWTLGHFS